MKQSLVSPRSAPTIAVILAAVAEHTGIGVRQLTGPDRRRRIARPRQMVMWLARRLTTHSLPEIARAVGREDHTTILHGIRQIERLRDKHAALKRDSDALLEKLRL